MLINLLIYFFSIILLISSLFVITVKNSVYSVLFLIMSFVSSSSLLFLFECEFVALLFIIIYVGAIGVLFLFVVMMLDLKKGNLNKDSLKYFPFGLFLGIFFLIEILSIVSENFRQNPYSESILVNHHSNWYDKLDSITDMEALGQVLYTHCVLQLLIAGFILFLAVVGAVVLTVNLSKQKNNSQIISKQLSRSYVDINIID